MKESEAHGVCNLVREAEVFSATSIVRHIEEVTPVRRSLIPMAVVLLAGMGFIGQTVPASAAVPPLTLAYIETSNDLAGLNVGQFNNVTVNFSAGTDTYQVSWGGGQDVGTLNIPGPLVVGQVTSPHLTVSQGNDGCNLNGQPANTALEVDQLTMVGTTVQTFAVQFQCFNQPLNNVILGSVGLNIVPTTPGKGYYIYGNNGFLAGYGNDAYLAYLGDLSTVSFEPTRGRHGNNSGRCWILDGCCRWRNL